MRGPNEYCIVQEVSVGVLTWGVSFLNHNTLPDKHNQQNWGANTKLQFLLMAMVTQAAVQ